MKKYILPLILTSLVMVACNKNQTPTTEFDRNSISIITPTGAPALAFYNFSESNNYETNSNAAEGIIPVMVGAKKDVIVLPTNAGIQQIVKGSLPYKIAATITFGNFFVASLNNDDNGVMDANDTIVLFQEKQVPDKIFHYIYGNDLNDAIHYVTAVSDAQSTLISGTFDDKKSGTTMTANYVMIAEPALTAVLNDKTKTTNVTTYADIQEKYKEKSGNKEMFQASIFVKNSLDHEIANSFLSTIKKDIEEAISDPSKLSAGMSKKGENAKQFFGVPHQMAEAVMKKNNAIGLGFKYAKENKEGIQNFLSIFGIDGSNEALYF